jgi:phosphoribosylaminoimidazolecarboxamide formyltransferase/IMP cyclohydrolase
MAEALIDVYTEVIVAPSYDPAALALLATKKNLRVLEVGGPHRGPRLEMRSISGGVLVQSVDDIEADGDRPASWQLVCGEQADEQTLSDLQFAWRAVRSAKSNAILLARGGAAVGIGMGQVNRVDSARLAVDRAGGRAAGSVASSDAFFPFADGLEVLINAGVRFIVQPGGSVRDDEVIDAARASGVTMYLTGTRHFFH